MHSPWCYWSSTPAPPTSCTARQLQYQSGMTVLTIREPHGVRYGHIIPWNYPMQIFGRSVGAALRGPAMPVS